MVCLNSLKGDMKEADRWLEKLLALGFKDAKALETDPDLAAFRASPLYSETLARRVGG